ncbi:hypothetical protein VOLCADRAFT_107019 [Volvox carteri f. nagariensis]|uniref:Uncharacterized protein n=1 Tax=Volvox carteri f. nagariensis TaxID=3068 RepID=D8UBC4_VOLCA|nr:uncharacterized protein VOLCADRAFT_107019 [Volvox carteri f. nagariensis]EFJ42924.1 hypothetical protein VOLCADRAFT_107019 [Volvox carteri f. nagariensis]|eukprot:XP_002955964.1 hypothetical protein VOLCADRAFT_107019 [Volvox carteri f. nagariensis]
MGGSLLAASAAVLGGYGVLPFGCEQARARPQQPLPLPPCSGPLAGQLAAALTRAVYSSVVHLQVMDEEDFQRENFKLREREYKYYAEANRAQLPRIPDLADNTGGLSNRAYFNFIHYCLWKVVYRHVTAAEDREAFATEAAKEFLQNLSRVGFEPGSDAAVLVRSVVLPFLELLLAGGYICRYQLVLGSHPGSWPQDWMVSQPTVMELDGAVATGDEEEAEQPWQQQQQQQGGGGGTDTQGVAEGVSSEVGVGPGPGAGAGAGRVQAGCEFLFQVKLHRPADILGSVALRSEEGGAWPRTVSRCLSSLLLERQQVLRRGCCEEDAAAVAAAARRQPLLTSSSSSSSLPPSLASTSSAVAAPSLAPASSSGAAVPAPQPSELQFLDVPTVQRGLGLGGSCLAAVECDEFFYQDEWQGPKSFTDKVLLFFGDPLEQVGVDFVPTTLVQNWRLRVLSVAAAAEAATVQGLQ